jgi:hypothetical protein
VRQRTANKWQRKAILKRDGRQCRYCETEQGPFHIDHVRPYSKGGETTFGNLVAACAECNLRKGAREWTPLPEMTTKPARVRLLLRVAAELGHSMKRIPNNAVERRNHRGQRWTCSCGFSVITKRWGSSKPDLPEEVRRHLEWAWGAD